MIFEEWWEPAMASGYDAKWIKFVAKETWDAATAAERERCVKECQGVEAHWRKQAEKHNLDIDHGRRDGAIFCAITIRHPGGWR